MMKAKVNGEPTIRISMGELADAVADIVRKQAENGIDIVTDGEQGNRDFSHTCASGSPVLSRRAAPKAALDAMVGRSGRFPGIL